MRQHLVLLLLCGSPLYPAAVNPVANVTSIDIQDVVDAVDNHNWEQFFKIYGKAKTDDDRVKCLRRLFFSEPGHNVGRLGLVHALDTANRSVLEKLEISAQWKVYLLSIQPSLKYAFEHVDAGVLKRAKEIEAKKAAEAQKKENDKNKI